MNYYEKIREELINNENYQIQDFIKNSIILKNNNKKQITEKALHLLILEN